MPSHSFSRRHVLKTSLAAGGASLVAPWMVRGQPGAPAPAARLNIAWIGVNGMGFGNVAGCQDENVVAICDVDDNRIGRAAKLYPKARRFRDFRRMFDALGDEIDAVGVSTPDHTHFVAAMAAVQRGKHVFVQKPLTHTLWETRTLAEAVRKAGVVSQMGNQGHASEGIRLVKEWVEADVLGDVKEIVAWTNRPASGVGFHRGGRKAYPGAQPVPSGLDWDLWLGPLAEHPYHRDYHPGFWRGYWNFGSGGLGDIGCHTLDTPFWAYDLKTPERVEVEVSEVNDIYTVPGAVVTYHFAATAQRGPLRIKWYEGPSFPKLDEVPEGAPALQKGGGLLMFGSKATLFSNGMRPDSPRLFDEAQWQDFRRSRPEKTIPRIKGGPIKEWIQACKNEGPKPGSNFDYAGPLTELIQLGTIAIRSGQTVKWDAKNMKVTSDPALNRYVKVPPRKGWEV